MPRSIPRETSNAIHLRAGGAGVIAIVGIGFMPVPWEQAAIAKSPGFAIAEAPPPAPEKPDEAQLAIDKGVKFLRDQQNNQGNWEGSGNAIAAVMGNGGFSCLSLLALLNSGVPADDPAIQRGLTWLRTQEPNSTYVVGLQTAVFARAGDPADQPRIKRNVEWLLKARSRANGQFIGWSYTDKPSGQADGSNSSFAILGLDAARGAGVKIDADAWREIQQLYLKSQDAAGGWYYDKNRPVATFTMTTAACNGLLLSKANLKSEKPGDRPTPEAAALERGLTFVGQNFTVRPRAHAFDNLYGLARLGHNSGQRNFGMHDWYREGREFLLKDQHADGSWSVAGQLTDHWPIVSTSFALLFLAEGRKPMPAP